MEAEMIASTKAGKSVGDALRTIAEANRTPAEVEADDRKTEKAFMADVIREAKRSGWRCYHTYSSKRSEAGFPDLILIRGKVLIAAELKTNTGKLTPAQDEWLQLFNGVTGCYGVEWRPRDWPTIEGWLREGEPR
jgi:hypothetical protein